MEIFNSCMLDSSIYKNHNYVFNVYLILSRLVIDVKIVKY